MTDRPVITDHGLEKHLALAFGQLQDIRAGIDLYLRDLERVESGH